MICLHRLDLGFGILGIPSILGPWAVEKRRAFVVVGLCPSTGGCSPWLPPLKAIPDILSNLEMCNSCGYSQRLDASFEEVENVVRRSAQSLGYESRESCAGPRTPRVPSSSPHEVLGAEITQERNSVTAIGLACFVSREEARLTESQTLDHATLFQLASSTADGLPF